jgi:transcriptional regulator GlxA family with amidase domain
MIGILLFDDVEELDAVGPYEVLAFWTRYWPDDGYAVCTFAATAGLVRAAKGLGIEAQYSYADVPPLEVLVYPGGAGARRRHVGDQDQLEWLRRTRAAVPLLTSVCTGSLVLAAAGLLRNRPATTYWSHLTKLTDLDPTIEVRPDDRFVDDGDVITAAGVSAGIDMALHLVARLAGADRAREVRRGIQYDPAPPV